MDRRSLLTLLRCHMTYSHELLSWSKRRGRGGHSIIEEGCTPKDLSILKGQARVYNPEKAYKFKDKTTPLKREKNIFGTFRRLKFFIKKVIRLGTSEELFQGIYTSTCHASKWNILKGRTYSFHIHRFYWL